MLKSIVNKLKKFIDNYIMDEYWLVRNRVFFKLWYWILKVDIYCGNWNICIILVELVINEINLMGFNKNFK